MIKLAAKTSDGLWLYDLDPSASDLWVVAGPDTDDKIDPDDLPTGFRWVTGEEWESLQSKVSDDFRTDHLEGDSLKVAKIIKDVIGGDASGGGCRAFWTAKEWASRGEEYGTDSVLVLVHDGGDLAPFCNWNYQQYSLTEQLAEALAKAGYYYEQCTCWYSAVYGLPS